MADRATRPEDSERHVFDLEKDERWQARLAEARVRREIALREKANSETPPKRRIKPWEEDGQGDLPDFEELEALLAPEEDDRLDFADRVKTLRKTVEPEPRRPGDNGGPSLGRPGLTAVPTPAAESEGDDASDSRTDEARSEAARVADRYIKALSPDFTPVRPYVPETYEAPGFNPAIVSETLSADDSERIAREYASTIKTADATAQPADEVEPHPVTARRRRRGVPLMLLAGVCILAVLPFTTTVPPLEIGPVNRISTPIFGLPPALGITRPMNAFPVETQSGEWVPVTKRAPGGPLVLPLDRAASMQRSVAPIVPLGTGDAAFGPLAWTPVAPVAIDRAAVGLPASAADRLPGAGSEAPRPTAEAVAEAEETPAFPAPLSLLRVTILVPATADPALADDLTANLEARGHEIASVKPVNLKISERNVRFFHEEDRGEAARLAEAYGGLLRDFTNFRPSPAEGTVEIWLAGEGLPAREPAQRPAPQVQVQQVVPVPRVVIVQRQPTLLERLTGGLIGGHQGDGLPNPSSGGGTAGGSPVLGGADPGTGTVTSPSDPAASTGSDPTSGGGTTGGSDPNGGTSGTTTGGTSTGGTTTGGATTGGTTTGGTTTGSGTTGSGTGSTDGSTSGTGSTTGGTTGSSTGSTGSTTSGSGSTTGGSGSTGGSSGSSSSGSGGTTGGSGTSSGGSGSTSSTGSGS